MNIAFSLSETLPVQISVVDVTGRQCMIVDKGLINENQSQNFPVDISSLQSGVYSVVLISGNRLVKAGRILKL